MGGVKEPESGVIVWSGLDNHIAVYAPDDPNAAYGQSVKEPIILLTGVAYGMKAVAISRGFAPCAYIEIPRHHPFYDKNLQKIQNLYSISCHGGITYFQKGVAGYTRDGFWIGWDYAHTPFDYVYTSGNPERKGKKWTPASIREEIVFVAMQIHNIGAEKHGE